MARPLNEIMDEGWAKALEPVADRIAEMGDFLRREIADGRTYLSTAPWLALIPGAVIALVVLSANRVGKFVERAL